jgi:hypothetical protein
MPGYCEPVFDRIISVPALPSRVVAEYIMPTENVVLSVRMHPVAIIRPITVIAVSLFAASIVSDIVSPAFSWIMTFTWIVWGVLFLWQCWRLVTWWRRYFVVTENRLMLITNLLVVDVGMMPLAKVTDMRFHQTTFGRMFRYGAFIVESAGQDQALSRVQPVPYATDVYQRILSLIFPSMSGPPSLPPPGSSDPSGPSGPSAPSAPSEPSAPSGPAGPSWPGAPALRPSERPGDDPGF